MSEYRPVKTEIWRDNWFPSLTTDEKVIWFFLLTNEHVHISGIYQLPKPLISPYTGVPDAEKILDKFEADGKVIYRCGYLFLVNYLKNQTKQINKKDNIIKSVIAFLSENPKLVEMFDLKNRDPYKVLLSPLEAPSKPLVSEVDPPSLNRKEEMGNRKGEMGNEKGEGLSPLADQNGRDGPKTITAGSIGLTRWDDVKVRSLLADHWIPYLEDCPARFKGDREWESQTHDGRWLKYSGSIVENLVWKK